jgi:ubiquinone/menaquinone biosynthesis C-methylase UbiE
MNINKLIKIVGSRLESIEQIEKQGEKWCNFFVSRGMIKPGMKVLDYGAGLGRLAIPFSKIATVKALDVNPDMVEYLNEHGVEASVASDCEGVEGTFDFVISCYVFEHNMIEDVQKLIQQMSKITDVLYFTYPTIEVFNGVFPNNYQHYKELERLPLIENTQTSRMMFHRELPILVEGSTFDSNSLTWIKDIGANLFRVSKRRK